MKPVVCCRYDELSSHLRDLRSKGKTIGFVPTMGALHEGHAELLRQSVSENDVTVLSIFVNPKQFGPKEDFSRYPRSFSADIEVADACGVNVVFSPIAAEMYPETFSTQVAVPNLSAVLCGRFRPGHFDGVCTVVLLLLNQVGANRAYFGLKDFQQYLIIRRMCADLRHPTAIVPVPTIRESDGLAMSSRNRFLDEAGRVRAGAVPRALAAAARSFTEEGERCVETLRERAAEVLAAEGLKPQYLEIRDVDTLVEMSGNLATPGVLALAQFVDTPSGTVRLIDNIVFHEGDGFWNGILVDLIQRVG